jgi:hypothetical protein
MSRPNRLSANDRCRASETQAGQVSPDSVEEPAGDGSSNVFDKDGLGRHAPAVQRLNESQNGWPKVSRIVSATAGAREGVRLAGDSAVDDPRASAVERMAQVFAHLWAVEGSHVRPDRSCREMALLNSPGENPSRVEVSLNVEDRAQAGESELQAEVKASDSRAEGDGADGT